MPSNVPSESPAPDPKTLDRKAKEQDLLEKISKLYDRLHVLRDEQEIVNTTYASSNGCQSPFQEDLPGTAKRVLLVTKRLPFRLTKDESSGHWRADVFENEIFDASLQNCRNLQSRYRCVWIGMISTSELESIDSSEQQVIRDELLREYNYFPIFVPARKQQLFDSGFCQTVLWPLFHSVQPTIEDQMDDAEYDERDNETLAWHAYVSVNQIFADSIQELYEPGDVLFILDYPFTLLPQMVRSQFSTNNVQSTLSHFPIGYFQHIPFPSSELYRTSKYREEIIHGILGADQIGFQTYEYSRHFHSAAVRILGLESNHKGIAVPSLDHFARVTICPTGIDVQTFEIAAQSPKVQEKAIELESKFEGRKIILGVDALDATSGLVHKFLAIDELFSAAPELAQEVVIIQLVVSPPDTGGATPGIASSKFSNQQQLEHQIEAMVSRINSKVQRVGGDSPPIQYITRDVPSEELIALYCAADMLITSPIRDGMNIVPFQYVVCREVHGAVARVVLSEFAGCAQSLGGAMLINPWNTEHFAETILSALEQDDDDGIENHQHMYQYVKTFTSDRWSQNFIDQLMEQNEFDKSPTSGRELSPRDIQTAYGRTRRRVMMFNYEGVLAEDTSIPELYTPPGDTLECLRQLAQDPHNTVIIVSSRSASILAKWFHDLPVILAAEYGVYIRFSTDESWHCTKANLDLSWWEDVIPILEYYTERTPGAYIERKESSVTWHYRDCDLDHGNWQALELQITLREQTRRMAVTVIPGEKSLEIRSQTVSKATLFENIWNCLSVASHADTGSMSSPRRNMNPTWSETLPDGPLTLPVSAAMEQEVDFVLVIASGTDRTDEDLFSLLIPPPIDLKTYNFETEDEPAFNIEPFVVQEPSRKSKDPLDAILTLPASSASELRKDFPPSVALYEAMQQKYGHSFGMNKLPEMNTPKKKLVQASNNVGSMDVNPPMNEDKHAGNRKATANVSFYDSAKLPVNTFVCCIGQKLSQAPYYLRKGNYLMELLNTMTSITITGGSSGDIVTPITEGKA